MKTKIISILWWSLTHPVALLTTLAKLGCSLAIIFAIVVSVCEIKIDFIEQGKKALISEIFNAGYSSNTSLTVASLRDFEDYDWEIDPEQEQQLAAATDMHHNFAYSQDIIAPLGSQDRFSLSDSTVFNLDKNINSGISYQNFNDKGFALIDSINEYTKAHPELQNDPHYQDLIKAQIAQIYFNSTLLPEHMSADIGLANTIAAITEKEAPALEPAPASNSRANSNKVALPQEFAHNSQETIPCSEPITEQITEPALAANDLASNHEAHSPYGYQDPDYSNDTPNGYQHNSYQNHNSLYSSLRSSSLTSNSLNGSYNHGHGHSNSHSQGSSQHESELKSTARYQNHNLNRNLNLKNTRDDLYLAQEGKLHHQQSLASTNSSLKGQTYVYSHNHNLQPNQELKSLSPNSRSSSNYALEPNANLAMSNTPNSALTHHGLMSSDGILEEEEEELVLALPGSKSLTPSQAATITTSSASQNHMLSQGHNLSHGHGLNQSNDLSKSQNHALSHSLSYSNSFEQEAILAQTQDAYYSQTNTNKIASAKAQLYLSVSESLGATISAPEPTALTNSSVTSTDPNPFASLSSLTPQASANSSSYSGSTLSMDTVSTPGSNSSYHHTSQSDNTTLSTSTSSGTGTGTGSSTLSSLSSSSIHQKPSSKLNNTNSYHNSSNNSHSSTSISSSQNDSSHYAIALAPTMTNNDMSTDHTISTAMVAALSTNTDPAAISTNTVTITANTDVLATGTTATEPATTTTVSSTDIAPATATATCTGTAITNTGTGTTANDSDGLATADTINGIGTAITVTGTGTGSDISGSGTGTAMGTGTGAANSDELDSEVAYLYRLDEELFDEEVERWDLETLEQLDLVIEDPEINLTAQDYQIIDEVMSTIDELRASGIAVDLDTVQMLCEHYMPQPYGTILLNNTKHEHLLSLLKSKQAKEQAKLAAVEQKESLVTELKDNSQPSKGQDDATLGAISNLATEQVHSLRKANAHTITNYPTKSGSQPSLGHSVFSVTNLVADDYIASMALETNTLYASLNTKMEANLGAPYSNALAYNYHDRLKSFNNSHSHSHDYNPNCAPAAIDTQATSPSETNTAATGGNLSLDEACEERVGEEASLNFEALGIKEVAPASPLMTPKQEPNNFLLLQKPIVLSKEGIVGLFSYPKRPVITQDALVINMRSYEKTHGSYYKQCLQMLGHWPDIQSLLNNYEDNGEKGLTPATLGIIKINNMLNAHHYWSDPLNISTTFFSLYNYCKDLDSGLIAPIYHHGIDVLKQLYVLSINSPSTLWCSPEHMLTYKQVTKHPTNNSNNGQAIFANSNLDQNHTQSASAPVPVHSTAEMNFKDQSESLAMAQLKAQAMSQAMAHAQAVAQAQGNVPSSSSGSIFYQGKGQELAPSYGKELAPTVESGLELGHSYGYKRDQSQVPSQEQALREEQHYESLLDDTNSESNYYGMRTQQHPNTANHQGLNQGYNSRPSSSSKQGSSNLLGKEPYQEQGNWSANSHGYSQGQSQSQDYDHGQSQGLGWENSKEMECDKSLGMDYSQEYEGHSPEAMMGTIPYEQSKQDSIELLGRTFNNSEDAKQALDQALGLSTAYDKHSYSTNHISYQTNALNGVKPFAKAAYNPTDLNEALDKQLIFNDLSYELMLPVYESLTEYQQAILESCQPWLLNKKLLSYDKERAFASILQNLTKLIKLKVLSPKEAYALAHGQRPKLLKEQDIVAFAIIGQIVKQAHESHQGKFTKEQAHDLKLLKQALYYAKWPLLEQCIDPNFAYRYSKIRLKYGYQGQIINPLSFITDTLEPHLSHSPSSGNSNNHGYSHGHGINSSHNIAQSTGLGLSTGTSTSHKLSSGHKLSTRAKPNLGSRGESEAMGHAHSQQHKQPEQQVQQQLLQEQQQQQQLMRQQYGNTLAMSRNKLVNEYSCQEDNAKVINEILSTAQNLRSLYQDLKTLEHGDILNSAQTIINAANRVGNNLPLNKSSTNTLSSVPNQSSITDINQVFATGPSPSTNTTNSTQSPTQ